MISIHFVLVILALLVFLVAALDVTVRRVNLIAAGLFLWLLSTLVVTGR